MIDLNVLPKPNDDGLHHINTHAKAKSKLGRFLSPSFDIGEPLHHPILGPFRSVENLWCYLNTGGSRDQIRTMDPNAARNFARLSPKYSCDKFRDLTIDITLLKLYTNSMWSQMVLDTELPFDHYYLKGQDRVPIRPSHSALFIGCLEEMREILKGDRKHEFVRFKDMNFQKLPEK